MNILGVMSDDRGGGAQVVCRKVLESLSCDHSVKEYVIFNEVDYGRLFFFRWMIALYRAALVCLSFRPSHVFTNLDASVYVFVPLSIIFRFKVTHIFHGPAPDDSELPGIRRLIYIFFVGRCDDLIFVSSEQRDRYLREFPLFNKVFSSVIRNPFFEKSEYLSSDRKGFFEALRKSSRYLILVPGRLSKQKNQAFAIQLLHERKLNGFDDVMIFCGDGEDKDFLMELAESLGIRFSVENSSSVPGDASLFFLGHCTDIQSMMASVDIVLMPSLYEGFPLALVEALCLGARVVSSNCHSGPGEILSIVSSCLLCNSDNNPLILCPAVFDERESVVPWLDGLSEITKRESLNSETLTKIKNAFSSEKFAKELRSHLSYANG